MVRVDISSEISALYFLEIMMEGCMGSIAHSFIGAGRKKI